MRLWSEKILPRLMHSCMSAERHAMYRADAVLHAKGNVLEIGFGSGLNLAYYGKEGSRVTGLEPNPGMRRIAVRTMHEYSFPVTLLAGTAEEMPFENGEFDSIVSTWTLCSIRNLESALQECRRALKPGGEFLFYEHGLAPDPILQKKQHRWSKITPYLFDGCRVDRPMDKLIGSAGFEITSLKNFFMPAVPQTEGYMFAGIAIKS
ncbi:class I SAM-dependent methyltransferase [bacterium]|nr:class I SAM-dependent methyltransferase [bacterium]